MESKNEKHTRGGYIIFRRNSETTRPIFWLSRRLRRVARSSSTAEISSAADALGEAHYLNCLVGEIYKESQLDCTTDSRSLFQLIATNKQPEESYNKIDLACMREMFENGQVHRIPWISGTYLVADALTKDNRETADLLKRALRDGKYPKHPNEQQIITPKGTCNETCNSTDNSDVC